jgi:hypothetical protein
MPFVYEEISAEDWVKYGFEAIDTQFKYWTRRDKHWTRDCERDMYLRYMSQGGPDSYQDKNFIFYWHGLLMEVDVHLEYSDLGNNQYRAEWRLYKKTTSTFIPMPKPLQQCAPELLTDLKEALTAYSTRPDLRGEKINCDVTFNF